MPTGIITGASRGLGLALASALAAGNWRLIVDGRDAEALAAAATQIGGDVTALAGDIADAAHRHALADAAWPRSTCSSTTPARSAPARCRRWPTTRSGRCTASSP